jgi:hypothetical protein
MFDAATLAEFLHHSTSETLMVLGDLMEERPEDPYARALLAEANRWLVAAVISLPVDPGPIGESKRAFLMSVIRGAGPQDAIEEYRVRHAQEEIRLLTTRLANWACLRPTERPDRV